jgi:hypothetical protein
MALVAVGAMFTATLVGVAANPAVAADPMTCVNFGGAPGISGSGGVITSYYSHRCNSLPGGVTGMDEDLILARRPVGGSSYTAQHIESRTHRQTGVDFSFDHTIGSDHGYWIAIMDLTITGNFSYGSVSGCGRIDSNVVHCGWVSSEHYF